MKLTLIKAAHAMPAGELADRGPANQPQGDPVAEIQACNQVIETWANSRAQIAWAFYHRGNAYTAQEDYDRAIQDYDIAIELKPDHSHAYADRGLAYFGKGAFERAVADYD